MTAGELLTHYYAQRARHFGRPNPKGWRNAAFDAAERYLARCEKEGVDPLHFIEWRMQHTAKASRYAPAITRLIGPKSLASYRERGRGVVHMQRAHDALTAEFDETRVSSGLRELAELHHMHEAMRMSHRGSETICMVERELSGGYHPKSGVCQACPIGLRCAAALNEAYGWDVVNYRAGRVDVVPARLRLAIAQ